MNALLVPIAHGFGTTGRLLTIARELQQRGHQAAFAVAESYVPSIVQNGFTAKVIPAATVDEHADDSPLVQMLMQEATTDLLERQVSMLCDIIRSGQHDIVIFSQNMGAAIAAATANVPTVSVFHPTIIEFHDLPEFWALFRSWRKFAALKKEFQPPKEVSSTILGDLNFIPSIPSLVYWPFVQPLEIYFRKVPVKTVGALPRVRPEELPSQEELKREFGVGGEPFVYATIGGAIADQEFLHSVIDGLRRSGLRALVTAGSGFSESALNEMSDERVRVVKFLAQPMRAIKACDVMVWHGGHETMLEAVVAARPAVGVPYQYDQFDNVRLLAKAGAGLSVEKSDLSADVLAQAIRRTVEDASFASAAQRLKLINDSLGGVVRLVDSIEAFLSGGRQV
jgi:UDP:flavonoid glycosyltransferase YjiC (YdhE family)